MCAYTAQAGPASPGPGTDCGRVGPVASDRPHMATPDQLKISLTAHNLRYIWDFDLYDDYYHVGGYKIHRGGFLSRPGYATPLGRISTDDLRNMSCAELEEFVIRCSVLSMEEVPWQA